MLSDVDESIELARAIHRWPRCDAALIEHIRRAPA
jgi:hypothetical protein